MDTHDTHTHTHAVGEAHADGEPDHVHGDHDHAHGDHHHDQPRGLARLVAALGLGHDHSHDHLSPAELAGAPEAIRATKISLAALGVTALAQAIVVVMTNSVALLADTLHNLADALTAIPLWIAFKLGTRPRSSRFTHGYGRAEDIAGIVIVLAIGLSSILTLIESVRRLDNPEPLSVLPAVIIAGFVGAAGNEAVARYRMTVGRRIGSAALVADGLHARSDALTSLAVVFGAIGVGVGWARADAVAGILIGVAILGVMWSAARRVGGRLLDAIEPELVDQFASTATDVNEVRGVRDVRLRWVGNELHGEADLLVEGGLTVDEAHDICVSTEHALLHAMPRLTTVRLHTDPVGPAAEAAHAQLAHHNRSTHEVDENPTA